MWTVTKINMIDLINLFLIVDLNVLTKIISEEKIINSVSVLPQGSEGSTCRVEIHPVSKFFVIEEGRLRC